MTAEKTGAFIAALRNEKSMTVAGLAAAAGTDVKTVNKWESGKKLPSKADVTAICSCFGISVNELLAGQRIADDQYRKFAEDNLYASVGQTENSMKKAVAGAVAGWAAIAAGLVILVIIAFLPAGTGLFVAGLVTGLAVLGAGVATMAILEYNSYRYVCSNCGKNFVPSGGAYIVGPHSFGTRYLKCPHCGAKTWCRKSLR